MPQALEPPPGPIGDPTQAAPPATPEIVRNGPRGRHPTLRRAIARFVGDVAAMPAGQIEARWRAEVAEHLDGRTPGTRKHYVVRYRSALETALGPDHPALGVVSARGLSRKITMARRQASARPPSGGRSALADSAGLASGGAAEGGPVPPGGSPHDPSRPVRETAIDGADRGKTEADTPDPAPRPHAHRPGTETPRDRPSPISPAPGDESLRDGEATRPVPAKRRPVGRPGVVREAAAVFVARLRQAASPAEVEALWTAELAAHADKADRTIKRITSEHYRPAILRAFGADHPALAIVKPPAEMSERIRADDIARVAASHRHQVAMPRWREIVARAASLLISDAPLDLVAGLLLATGRRPYEVCCTGRFAPAPLPDGSPGARLRWSVLFTGQAKTKGRPGTRHDTAYEIPVLAEARRVIAALDALRASPAGREWAGLRHEAFRATTLRLALTEAVTRAYGDLWPEGDRLEPRALRPLYAEVAHRRFGPAGVTKNSFFAAVLGHTMTDLHTSLSYMDYYLADEDGAGAHKVAAGVTDRLLRQSRAVGLDPG